ncbi:hypothetical protein HDG34_005671 [Paraburkholderia sp. HC6.4b]|nr:hypothetical protein [Paraburkholderia sp. HC6.4b]
MYDSIEQIRALFGVAEESVSLEFKSGRAFDEMNDRVRGTFVKEVTAFANAGGGTIIYGISEQRQGARNVAEDFEPVTNPDVTKDQLTVILTSNTDPVFSGFQIDIFPVEPRGRVFVIHVEQGDTAYQSRHDKRYYQRIGTTSEAMYDFSIRDVMNRRKAPRLFANLSIRNLQREAKQHRYRLIPTLKNEGVFTVHHWCLLVDIPTPTHLDPETGQSVLQRGPVRHENLQYTRFEYSSERLPPALNSLRLLPDQKLELTAQNGFPDLDLFVDLAAFVRSLETLEPPLRWTLFVDDAARKEGQTPFEQWCTF